MAAAVCVVLASASQTFAQRQGGVGQGGRGNFDPEQMRERMMQRYQEALGMSATEWAAVQPLVEDVIAKQREVGGGGGGMAALFGGRGGQGGAANPAGGGRNRFGREPAPELEALQQAIESGTTAEIKTKLAAFRDARTKKEADLKESRDKLRKVLTAKQEAQMVLMGTLD
jgi:hypothetical protein